MITHLQSLPLGDLCFNQLCNFRKTSPEENIWGLQLGLTSEDKGLTTISTSLPVSSPIQWCLFICIDRFLPGVRNRNTTNNSLDRRQIYQLNERQSWLGKISSSVQGKSPRLNFYIAVWVWGEHLSEEGDCCSGHTRPCVSTPTFSHFPQIILTYSRVNALKQAHCLLSQIKFYWTQPCPFVYISLAVFALQWKS